MSGVALGRGREFDLIRSFIAAAGPAAVKDVRVGSGDDCAVVGDLAISVDMSVEDVHFRREWLEPEEIGYRAAAAALSDLAAVAARPVGILVALAASAEDATTLGTRIMDGCAAAARAAGAALIGGDLSRSPGGLAIDVVVLGNTANPVLRSGALPGDEVWVTGSLGGAAAAVRAWKTGRTPPHTAREAFVRPQPRTAEAQWLAGRAGVTSLIDLSDGLAGDAGHIAAASSARIIIDTTIVPVHPAVLEVAASHDETLRLALAGGEDYELCFTARVNDVAAVREEFSRAFGVDLTRVGVVERGAGVVLRAENGDMADVRAWDHLSGD